MNISATNIQFYWQVLKIKISNSLIRLRFNLNLTKQKKAALTKAASSNYFQKRKLLLNKFQTKIAF